ncbi:hypothetical protein P8452_36648 [Trifolium repens]|nr:hypothetical protein P8452_36648 [Trifolium repens]
MWFWTLVTPYKPKQYAILVKQKGNHKKFRDKKEFQSWITTILMIANWNCTDGSKKKVFFFSLPIFSYNKTTKII